jgi:hypothetical protein
VTLVGGYKSEASLVTGHIEQAKLHSKNNYLIVSSLEEKIDALFPC